MIPLFLGLTLLNVLCLTASTALGYLARGGRHGDWHLLAGAAAAITCCGVHCVVFTYFAATGKWARHAVAVGRLEPALAGPTRSFRMQAFPAAMLAMGAVLLAAFSGAAADNYPGPVAAWHHGFAWLCLAANAGAAVVQYRAIRRNGCLIDAILAALADRTVAPVPSQPHSPRGAS